MPMRPTTNTPFERFAFATVIFLTFLLPVIVIVLVFLASLLTRDANNGIMTGLMVIIVATSTFGIPIFCIASAIKIENDHLKALTKAEAELSDIVVSDMKTLPSNWKAVKTVFLSDNVVIANDYLKTFFWTFRKLVGGESTSFSRLFSRARREATVRILRKAKASGANVVWNIRYETCTIQSNYAKDGTKTIAGVEVLAYATAFTIAAE